MRIDFDHLRRYTGDDDTLIAEVLGMFADQTAMWVRALDPSADDDSWSSVAHALKGSAATVGAEELGRLCDRAEAMTIGSAGPSALKAKRDYILGAIETEVDLVSADIQRWEYETEMKRMRGVA